MGHSIPVMYLLCDPTEVPASLASWIDAQELLTKAHRDKDKYHLYSAIGRNWWQIQAVKEIRNRNKLDGLDFVDREVAIVSSAVLPVAIDSIHKVIAELRLKDQIGEMHSVGISRDIECDIEGGFEEFLGSLLVVLNSARNTRRVVVFVQPQP